MAVEFNDAKQKVQVEVIDELSGVAYEGKDYMHGDKFTCTADWAAVLTQSDKVRVVEDKKTAKA